MRAVVLDGPGPPEALRIRDVPIPIDVYTLDQIQQAHADMENNIDTGKLVVRVDDWGS